MRCPPDDCVRTLAGEGRSYKEARKRATKLVETTTEENMQLFERAKTVLNVMWPVLSEHETDEKTRQKAEELDSLLKSEAFF